LKVFSPADIFLKLQDISLCPDIYDLMHRLSLILKYLRKIINIGAPLEVQVDIGWRKNF